MSKYIQKKTEIVISQDKIDGGYIVKRNYYECQRSWRGLGPDLYPSYRNELVGYSISYYNDNDQLHRDGDQPAYQYYYRNDTLQEESWYTNGELIKIVDHRKYNDGSISKNGDLITKIYYKINLPEITN